MAQLQMKLFHVFSAEYGELHIPFAFISIVILRFLDGIIVGFS